MINAEGVFGCGCNKTSVGFLAEDVAASVYDVDGMKKRCGSIPPFVIFSRRASLVYIHCSSGNVQVLCQYTNHQPHGVTTFTSRMKFCGQ